MAVCGEGFGMVFEFERAAMNGDPMPHGLALEDQMAYQALARLYARYRAGYIARQDGAREKRQIEKARENAKARIRYSKYSGQFFKTVEWYATDYRKRRTIEAADKLVDAVDGFLKGVPGSGSTDLHK